MEVPIVHDIVIIFALSIAVLLFCHRLRLPPIVGFLITGVLCGPHSLKLVADVADVENLATIGIVLLLFIVGMEFSIKNIIKYKYFFFAGGLLQIFLTLIIALGMAKWAMGLSWQHAIFISFLLPLSSTAIVLRMMDERGESETPHGRLILGILIFQDIVAVPMMLLVPLLSGALGEFQWVYLYEFGKGVAFILLLATIAFYGVPRLLYYVTRTRNRELFLLSVLTICFAVAWITSSVGLSVSLGAFLAGLVVSESEYSDEAVGNVLPFQTIFTSFFFVSMGMLLDINFFVHQPLIILLITIVVLAIKATVVAGAALMMGMPLRSAILAGLALAQIGEFAFVIADIGMEHQLMSEYQYQLFLSVSLLSMAVTPVIIALSPSFVRWLDKMPFPQKIKMGRHYLGEREEKRKTEMIIVGFGLRGRHLARIAKEIDVAYVVLEMNPETVKMEKKKGEPIRYGDPSHPSILLHAGIKAASTIVVVINDPVATRRIVKIARMLNPEVHIITRTRYMNEVANMLSAGANEVVPDEFGSSIEIFTRVLQYRDFSEERIADYVSQLRREGETLFKSATKESIEISL